MMERKRTIYRLRDYKTSIVLCLFLGTVSISLLAFSSIFNSSINSALREKATTVLVSNYNNNLSLAIENCDKAFSYIEKASLLAMLVSVMGFIMVFLFLRIDKPSPQKYFALNIFQLGGLVIVIMMILVVFNLPSSGNLQNVLYNLRFLKISGIIMLSLSYALFIWHMLKRIVFELED